ncbi:DUF4097 family beta strand repeat-containing protein [Deminuibacter soli]|uniref:DUF4097 domain-containing protein n=1 Tax=Deminuibacter soli TaxID=2291815 RepID=A0A3E1ND03_9BACT|nr:hypothetical protein [Deminuibacter soli]RFM25889.1 hypothetical protein DXN05_22465 [Deminuibacter soli]
MKKYFLLLAALLPGMILLAQSDDQKPYLTKSLSDQHIKNVEVGTSGGSITVAGSTASEARVEVYISGNKNLSKEEIESRLQKYELTVSVNGDKLTAIAKRKSENFNWNNSGLSIAFKVYVPGDVSTRLGTSGGSIHLSKLNGEQNFSTSGGSLHINDMTGKVHGSTSGGSIHIENAKSDVNLTTSGGSIEASNCQGTISLHTSGGSLHLENLNGTIEASTSGGSIHGTKISGDFTTSTSGGSVHLDDLACTLDASTSAGSIDVAFNTLGKSVKLSNSGGNVSLSIPGGKGLDLKLRGNKISTTQLSNFKGDVEEGSINGQLNGGGIPIKVDAGGGRINLAIR